MAKDNVIIVGGDGEEQKGIFDRVVADVDKQELKLYSLVPDSNAITQDNLLQNLTAISSQVASLLGLGSSVATVYTANATFKRPSTNRLILVECIGGGGGGGVANAAADGVSASTGGSGGEYRSAFFFTSLLPATVTITIGAGGASKTTVGREALAGNAGSTSTFGSFLSANGGLGGNSAIAAGTGTVAPAAVSGGTGGTTTLIALSNENGGDSGSEVANGTTCGHTENVGANSTKSGAGGGGANGNNPCASGFSSLGGTSTSAGNGGAGSNSTATAGSTGGGGGGGAAHKNSNVTSGAGGGGKVLVTIF